MSSTQYEPNHQNQMHCQLMIWSHNRYVLYHDEVGLSYPPAKIHPRVDDATSTWVSILPTVKSPKSSALPRVAYGYIINSI